MMTKGWRRLLAIPVVGGILLVLTACGPTAELTSCKSTDTGAKYTISVSNESSDKTYTARLLVSEHKLTLNRDGENMTLKPGETKTFTVNIKKNQERNVGVLWPGPKGDDTYKFKEQLDGTCN